MEKRKPVERIKIFATMSNLKIAKFERMIGVNQNTIQTAIKRNSNMSDETLSKIIVKFPNLNINWVLTGKGKMLLSEEFTQEDRSEIEEPDFEEVLQLIKVIDDKDISILLQEKIFKLYQLNSQLKSDLLRIYRLTDNL